MMSSYRHRAPGLHLMNLFTFGLCTVEERQFGRRNSLSRRQFPYLINGDPSTPGLRVLRSRTHELIPNFTGHWVTDDNDSDTHAVFCAFMLMLFKPWVDLCDIHTSFPSFSDAYTDFVNSADKDTVAIIENLQCLPECHQLFKKRSSSIVCCIYLRSAQILTVRD